MPTTYAWILDTDDLGDEPDAIGKTGPHSAPDELIAKLAQGEGLRFELRDDDHELYYTGRLITLEDDDLRSEVACSGPLMDFGMPNAGCTMVRYPTRPDLDCG